MKQLFLIISIFWFSQNIFSQISAGGTPRSWQLNSPILTDTTVLHVATSAFKTSGISKVASNSKNSNGSLTFAKVVSVSIDNQNNGTWQILEDNSRVWTTSIKSEGAYSLNFTFSQFVIPSDAEVFVYSADHSVLLGAFTAENAKANHKLAIAPVKGNQIYIEYYEPANAEFDGMLAIDKVGHDYLNIFGNKDGNFGRSGACNVDINCAEGANWQKEKLAVCRMIIENSILCTGVLVNNTNQDQTPYVLSANHCVNTQAMAENTVFCFNYESETCDGADGNTSQTISGADLVATKNNDNGYLDFALVKLSTNVPLTYNPYYAGWDASGAIPENTSCIHHPWGDVKKIAIDNDAPLKTSYVEEDYDKNTFWEVLKWDVATTEKGSSGSPLFDQNHRVVGTLSGGAATCDDPVYDLYQMISASYETYKTDSTQLKHWLNPGNLAIDHLDGFRPAGAIEVSDKSVIYHFDMSQSAGIYTTDGGYVSGNNKYKDKAKAEFFNMDEFDGRNVITGGLVFFYLGTGSDDLDVEIFVMDEKDGAPNTKLGSTTVKMGDIKKSTGKALEFSFPTPIIINTSVYVGVSIPQGVGDTIALFNSNEKPSVNSAWELPAKGGWIPYNTSWEGNWMNYIAVEIGRATSIKKPELSASVNIYPNPASNAFTVAFYEPKLIMQVKVFDQNGRMVIIDDAMSGAEKLEINVRNWINGLYFIQILDTHGILFTKKLIINH